MSVRDIRIKPHTDCWTGSPLRPVHSRAWLAGVVSVVAVLADSERGQLMRNLRVGFVVPLLVSVGTVNRVRLDELLALRRYEHVV